MLLKAVRQPPQASSRSKAASSARLRRPASRCLLDHSLSNFKLNQRPAGRTLAQQLRERSISSSCVRQPCNEPAKHKPREWHIDCLWFRARSVSTQSCRLAALVPVPKPERRVSACVNGRPAGHHATHAALVRPSESRKS